MSVRKQRGANFSNEEKMALLNIIAKHQNIIENKKSDNTTIQEKNRAWMKTEVEFNSISPDGCYRDSATLKKFYENKKKEVRKAAADEKFEIRCTGGGPSRIVKKDPAHELILRLINIKTVKGIDNPFDSDSTNELAKADSKTVNQEFEYELNTEHDEYEIVEAAEKSPNFGMPVMDDEYNFNKSQDTQDFLSMLSDHAHKEIDMQSKEATDDDDVQDEDLFIQPRNKKSNNISSCTQQKESKILNKEPTNKNPVNVIKTIENKSEANTWKKYKPSNLQKMPSKELTNPQSARTPTSKEKMTQNKRKRPATVVRALTSSNIAVKYDTLVEKRLEIANMTIVEFHQKTNKHLKKMELLDLEISLKKRQLNQ